MTKTLQERIDDGAAEIVRASKYQVNPISLTDARMYAADAIRGADRERPVWPTRESMDVYIEYLGYDIDVEYVREGLRKAMLADPIIKQVGRVNTYRYSQGERKEIDDLIDLYEELVCGF